MNQIESVRAGDPSQLDGNKTQSVLKHFTRKVWEVTQIILGFACLLVLWVASSFAVAWIEHGEYKFWEWVEWASHSHNFYLWIIGSSILVLSFLLNAIGFIVDCVEAIIEARKK
jgi:hypothetical protein